MKFYMKFPDETEIKYETEPMRPEHFEMICWLIGIALVGGGFLKLFLAAAT